MRSCCDTADVPTAEPNASRALVAFAWLSNQVVRVTASGELRDDSGPALAAAIDRLFSVARGTVTMCWDLSRLQRWDPGSRREITRALFRHHRSISEHHVLATSPQLRMGTRITALTLGNMSCYHVRSLYEMAVDAAIRVEQRECA
jgi:hypothetical protein